jgi:hypothetical protein
VRGFNLAYTSIDAVSILLLKIGFMAQARKADFLFIDGNLV